MGAAAATGVSLYFAFNEAFPDVTVLRTQFVWVEDQGLDKPPRVTLRPERPSQWVSIDQISTYAIGAVVVSEDWTFFSHEGYDPYELKEALRKDIAEGRFARGASTITQQVVKNVFLSREKTLGRKIREFILSVDLDEKVSKKKILETYFNVVELGPRLYGINAASQHYFGKHPSELTPKEGAFIAMLLPSPKRYSESFRAKKLTSYAHRTVNSILRKMVKAKYLSQAHFTVAITEPLSFEATGEQP